MAELIKVESSMINAVSYDPESEELLEIFNSGRTYVYEGVPRKIL